MVLFSNSSIKRKLIAISIGASSIALGLAGGALGVNDLLVDKRSLVNRLSTQANIIGANSAAALIFNDRQSASQTLSALSAEPAIVAAGIYMQDDRLFADYHKTDVAAGLLANTFNGDSHQLNSGYLQVVRPIVLDGEKIGTVDLRADLQELYTQLGDQGRIIALVLLMSLLVALALSSRMQRMISEPILRLAKTADAISRDRNYSLRAEKQSQDEVGILTDAFNDMLAQIQDRDKKLESHKAHLELLVATRTAELGKLNSQLKNQKHHLEELVNKRTAELHALNEQLRHQAYHDTLTGLPNRALLNDRLTQAILHAQRNGQKLAVMFLDLDRFKYINDTLGHVVGDRLLHMVSARLRLLVRKDDTVARLGGDEFTILLSPITSSTDAGEVSQKILKALQNPFHCYGRDLHITTTIGIAVYPDDGIDTETLMRNADVAMYGAKGKGRNKYGFFAAHMHTESLQRLELENNLRTALAREDFEMYYQPQLDIHSGQIIAVESLVRWRQQDMGVVPPSVFIPILEETGLIIPVGEWILRNACMQAKTWQDSGQIPPILTVNFSSRQFNQQNLGEAVRQLLDQIGFSPELLTLEITESVLMDNMEETVRTLHELSAMGVHLAIDDFGTGYSSLDYLKRFPIDTIKIDKSFVQDITTDLDDAAIVKAIIAMGHALSLKVIAEGVETDEQLSFLRDCHCDAVQGYLFDKPLPHKELLERLSRC